jgi:hypothetical protein
MKKFLPFMLAIAGTLAAMGVLFLLVRTDHLSVNVRRPFDWRKAVDTALPQPVEEEAV